MFLPDYWPAYYQKATGIEIIPPTQISNVVDKEERFDILEKNISTIKNYILEKLI